jgi:hypothetical protein
MKMGQVSNEDVQHTFQLLEHIEVCKAVERQLDIIGVAYRHLLSCHAALILDSLGTATQLMDPVAVGQTVFAALHTTCNGGKTCRYTRKHEDDLISVVTLALERDSYRDTIMARAKKNGGVIDESCLDKRRHEALAKVRADSAGRLYRTHILRAVWKNAIGGGEEGECNLTALESLLLDGPSMVDLHVECKQALALLKQATDCVAALDDNRICRTCGIKPKRKHLVFAEHCDACKRVFFCSPFCKKQAKLDTILSHAKECDLLVK